MADDATMHHHHHAVTGVRAPMVSMPLRSRRSNASAGSAPGMTSHRCSVNILATRGSPAATRVVELATFPVAEVHLPQIGHHRRVHPDSAGEGRRRLHGSAEVGDVDGVDGGAVLVLGAQSSNQQDRLGTTRFVQGGVAVPVDE